VLARKGNQITRLEIAPGPHARTDEGNLGRK
jgi:hypothetical protein